MFVLTELGQTLAILRRALAGDVEQVVADEDARQVDVRPQTAELGVDVVVVGVQLIELGVDLLRLARRRSIDTTISSRRLPSPSAATGQVLNRTLTSSRATTTQRTPVRRASGHPV